MTDKAVEVQRRSFTKWMNAQLQRGDYDDVVETLEEDLVDGILLMKLLSVTTGQPLPNYIKKCKNEIHRVNNLGIALDMVKDAKIKLIGIGSHDLARGETRHILATLWAIIYAQQIGSIKGDDAKSSGKEGLLLWVSRAVAGYEGIEPVKNFKKAWSDGKILAALIHKHRPAFNYDEVMGLPPLERIQKCIDFASTELKVPQLIEAVDMEQAIDEKATMTYISEFFAAFSKQQTEGIAQRRITKFFETQKAVEGFQNDFEEKASDVLYFIEDHTRAIKESEIRTSLVDSKRQLDEVNDFRHKELAENRQAKKSLEGILSNLQTTLVCYNRPPYVPSPDLELANIDRLWQDFEDLAAQHFGEIREAYRKAKEETAEAYRTTSDGLHSEISKLLTSLRSLSGDDPAKLLDSVAKLQEEAASIAPTVEKAKKHATQLEAAKVNVDDLPGVQFNIDDIERDYSDLKTSLEKKKTFLERQVEAKKGSSVSSDKLAEIKETFDVFDKNLTGSLSLEEFIGALKGLGRDFSDEEAAKMFKENKSKATELTFDDFVKVMTKLESDADTMEEIIASVSTFQEGKGVTLDTLRDLVGDEGIEYFKGKIPQTEDGLFDFKAYIKNTFSKCASPRKRERKPSQIRRFDGTGLVNDEAKKEEKKEEKEKEGEEETKEGKKDEEKEVEGKGEGEEEEKGEPEEKKEEEKEEEGEKDKDKKQELLDTL